MDDAHLNFMTRSLPINFEYLIENQSALAITPVQGHGFSPSSLMRWEITVPGGLPFSVVADNDFQYGYVPVGGQFFVFLSEARDGETPYLLHFVGRKETREEAIAWITEA